ncbi:hypothetical protein CC78DRAFT_621292 [Lojkania enalia]|uniref:Uncharacterized protein n=1 Tax=Lojkania enalia TaxID=147567 RepID=A0A9P4K0E3_9PLEO|nr:hypothetical protein CC78DRAFT_621292 [Didymosphaeria enalia]
MTKHTCTDMPRSSYGKAIYKASSRLVFLRRWKAASKDTSYCTYEPGTFLIDLDLAIKEQREKSSGARGKTGTRAFMAIGWYHGSTNGILRSWALYHRSQLKDLVNGIISLVDSVEKIFPVPEKELALAQQETAAIQDKQALELVESAAHGVDNLLLAAAKEALAGHQYRNVTIKGKAQTGDSFSSDWRGKAQGAFHIYDGILVDKTAKALVGNKYGGKDFWDE